MKCTELGGVFSPRRFGSSGLKRDAYGAGGAAMRIVSDKKIPQPAAVWDVNHHGRVVS